MDFVNDFVFNDSPQVKQIPCIKGNGAPTTETVGAVGCFYMDTDNGAVYKCTSVESGVYEWKGMDGGNDTHYSNLSAAISDINNGVTTNALPNEDNACVKVFTAENGRQTVSLLADVEENALITVNEDIDIVLAGHTLRFTTVGAYLQFAAGTSCTINGEVAGSAIVKKGITGSENIRFISSDGTKLSVLGGEYELDVICTKAVTAVRASETSGVLELMGCRVSAINSSDPTAKDYATRGIQVDGGHLVVRDTKCEVATKATSCIAVDMWKVSSSTIERCNIHATVDGTKNAKAIVQDKGGILRVTDTLVYTDAPGSNATQSHSYGIAISADTEAYIETTEVYATHSGILNYGKLYVRGCILSGWSHGGLYALHDSTKVVVVKDTQLWSGYYDGQFPLEGLEAGGQADNCYFGYSWYGATDGSTMPGGDSYIDNCVFKYHPNVEGGYSNAFVVRDVAAGDTPNRVFISNSEFVNCPRFRCRGTDGKTPAEVYIGTGCGFGADDVINDEWSTGEGNGIIEETNSLYRKHYPGEELTAEDFAALVEFMNGAGVS